MSQHTATASATNAAGRAEHFDVIIVGAGISGVGGAYHLSQQRPEKSFVVLEGLESFGGGRESNRSNQTQDVQSLRKKVEADEIKDKNLEELERLYQELESFERAQHSSMFQ